MPVIQIQTEIHASIERVFNLCRSVEVHIASTSDTQEQSVGGITSGVLGLEDTVIWEATHLGVRQRLTSRITICEPPFFFQDRMVDGAFQSFTHNHAFYAESDITIVNDEFDFTSPFGPIGELFNQIVLTDYMRHFLEKRLRVVKRIAESDEWRNYLKDSALPSRVKYSSMALTEAPQPPNFGEPEFKVLGI